MPYTPQEKQQTLARIRRLKGQLEGLERAVEDDMPCRSNLQQIAAVRGAVNGLMAEVLEMHLRRELPQPLNNETDAGTCIDDAIALVRSYLK
ncbi:MAG TPA: metal/formaldehyde-sensitive transcriptional repressor [Candidatus Sulfotelmatobacter sp.]|jgi:DNA-binding FrmR family transcriptional regulator|nr:metal/formaldehyde-sensitive transcriptional repressor [Candidatus Sulfotelmatobacter sp.]